ncbi:DUF5937 family protein [Streptomyces sp. KL2]|uniref:ArsR/SmtB family transcription factor n=1 Tax=Streptomyces sp. KL2 TaxID=3050126 RepID=UPI00397AF874
MHRLQTSRGRWAYADWHRQAMEALTGTPVGRAVRRLLVPMLPRARYFPDFLNPHESAEGLEQGLAAIVDTPPERVARETARFGREHRAPGWAPKLVERENREELARALRAYHDAVVAPHHDRVCAEIEGECALRAREVLDRGVHGLLAELSPAMSWRAPVLHVDYVEDRDLYLGGRGLCLVPSYFCWRTPIALADAALPPVLVYPVQRPAPAAVVPPPESSLEALLGKTRAAALRALVPGATTSELARCLGVSPATATHHTTVLRDAGLVASRRLSNSVLHTLTPLGAAVLRHPSRSVPSVPAASPSL